MWPGQKTLNYGRKQKFSATEAIRGSDDKTTVEREKNGGQTTDSPFIEKRKEPKFWT